MFFSVALPLNHCCAIRNIFLTAVQCLTTKRINYVFVIFHLCQPELLTHQIRYRLFKNWCTIFLRIASHCQCLTILLAYYIYVVAHLQNVKTLIWLLVVVINDQHSLSVFVLTHIEHSLSLLWNYWNVLEYYRALLSSGWEKFSKFVWNFI